VISGKIPLRRAARQLIASWSVRDAIAPSPDLSCSACTSTAANIGTGAQGRKTGGSQSRHVLGYVDEKICYGLTS
jgi:hypothetical protein